MNRHRDSIPAELTVRPRFVSWRYELVDGRRTKIPYQCNGRRASSVDPATWCSWAQVLVAYDRGGYDGVGFVMNGDGLCGVDFDHCCSDGQITDQKIAKHVARLDSYTEVSPSGTGLRVLLSGKLPARDRKLGDIEMYDGAPYENGKPRGRFLTITGNHLAGTPMTINERQAELDAFHADVFAERILKRERARPPQITSILPQSEADLLDRARRARNGERFSRLYDEGAWQADFPSQSEADLWLLARLMFWTRGDEARADRLFRQSKLMREKWNCESYREHTMERARE